MIPSIQLGSRLPAAAHQVILLEPPYTTNSSDLDGKQIRKAQRVAEKAGGDFLVFHQDTGLKAFVFLKKEEDGNEHLEQIRIIGDSLRKSLQSHAISKVHIVYEGTQSRIPLALAEGMALGSYQFTKYKTQEKTGKSLLETIVIVSKTIEKEAIESLNIQLDVTAWARDLINEPLNNLSAADLAKAISEKATPLGIGVEILNKKRIEALRMGGLLAVNRGSIDPPTFSILEWKPLNAINDKPLVLVGKGVVFDTGGISIKPANNMEEMKSDMAGAATVAAITCAVAALKIPVHLIALIPATDNRPDGNAYVPGDIITMFDGTTVEVINTDAEGRMILADALTYAKKFDPMLVVSVATLTGSAARATGHLATPGMHHKASEWFESLRQAGEQTRERLVELPLWKEYEEMLHSTIADIKNVGGAEAGAITAGIFLKKFTDYPYIHLDIAGTAYLAKRHNYRGQGATGTGVRSLLQFIRYIAEK